MTVLQGQVTLSGDVASEGERTAIGNTVGTMPGVVGVTNLVTIRPECPDPDRTEALFEWDTDTGGTEIRIIVMDGRITVLGKVSSSRERDLAERIVQAASGITKVDNRVIWRLL